MDTIYHNSHDSAYRSPFGALRKGESVRLRLRAPHGARCQLRVTCAFAQPQYHALDMGAVAPDLYEYVLHWDIPDILWYSFAVYFPGGGVAHYGNAPDGKGGAGELAHDPLPGYQITVYDGAAAPPAWLRGAVMYQVFPDRFCREGQVPGKEGAYVYPRWNQPIDYAGDRQRIFYDKADYAGGTLVGIRGKLPYLQWLGVNVLYLNPIFEAASNHRYNTADYRRVDPLLGTEQDFRELCADARARGIRVMLDGVFAHTGSDSVYFNRYGRYPQLGAYQSTKSPYYSWYQFEEYPNHYKCWWGFDSLPATNKLDSAYQEFTLTGEDAVVVHWLKEGASGWRLDVADELSIEYLDKLCAAVRNCDPQAAVLGEVWEDASNKVAYDRPRPYVLGRQLDSATNYPLRETLIRFYQGKCSAGQVYRLLTSQRENYPPAVWHCLMNMTGTHDVPRLATLLLDAPVRGEDQGDAGIRAQMPPALLACARSRLLAMAGTLFALPGMVSVYYGDEIGMHGMADPFCREPFPWGSGDTMLQQAFARWAKWRHEHAALRQGGLELLEVGEDVLAFLRPLAGEATALTLSNRRAAAQTVSLAFDGDWRDAATGAVLSCQSGRLEVALPPLCTRLWLQA